MCKKDSIMFIENVLHDGKEYQLKSVNYIDEAGYFVKRHLMLFQDDKPVNIDVYHELTEHEYSIAEANRKDLEPIIDILIQRSFRNS